MKSSSQYPVPSTQFPVRSARFLTTMKRQDQWQPVLDAELQKWNAKSLAELVNELQVEQAYEVEFGGKRYQVEVQLLENTQKYLHVGVDVDDSSMPASLRPLGSVLFARNRAAKKASKHNARDSYSLLR